MTPADPAAVRMAGNADRTKICAMLGRAFAEDPAMSYIFPDAPSRARRAAKLFALLFDTDGPVGMRLTTPAYEAATLWRGPGHAHTGVWEMLRHAPSMVAALGTAIPRALRVADAIEAHHPVGDYWYLHVAGCEPAAQGRGLGGAAVRAGLRRVAGGGLPTYLETPLEKNIGFYQALGFEVTGDWTVPKGGPRFWSMLRAGDR